MTSSTKYFLFSCNCKHFFIGKKDKGQCSKCGLRSEGKALITLRGKQ